MHTGAVRKAKSLLAKEAVKMMTGLTIASGIGRTILVLLKLLFSNEQDLLLQCVLLGTTGWFYPRCLLLPRGTKPQAWGTDGRPAW